MAASARVLYLSHGGGPLPLLGDESHQEMVTCLEQISVKLDKPSAIIVISAHWEAAEPTMTTSAKPALIYDYSGFPEASYHIQYPCSGEPVLAEKLYQQLNHAGLTAKLDGQRGLDHGVFVPLKIMYPDADIPCIQLSLINGLDPSAHIDLGNAIAELDYDNLLVVGSGFSFHNMRAFFTPDNDESCRMNVAFEDWLVETCSSPSLSESERRQRLENWSQAPNARYCHPREEHLLPLHVCYGVAQTACQDVYRLTILNKHSSLYLW